MLVPRFAWKELYAGNRFLAPVSEAALLEAGRAAGLRAGATLLEVGCGSGAVALFLAEEFHLYARGVDASHDLLDAARRAAARSPAEGRVRFLHGDPEHGDPALGPVDALVALHGLADSWRPLLREEGAAIVGRFAPLRDPMPPGFAELFPATPAGGGGRAIHRHEATGVEWERYFQPQERELRAYRETLKPGDPVSPVALWADRRLQYFREHARAVAYELVVLG